MVCFPIRPITNKVLLPSAERPSPVILSTVARNRHTHPPSSPFPNNRHDTELYRTAENDCFCINILTPCIFLDSHRAIAGDETYRSLPTARRRHSSAIPAIYGFRGNALQLERSPSPGC